MAMFPFAFPQGRITLALCVIWLGLFGADASIADIYRWTDDRGVTHISDQPPSEGSQNKPVRIIKMPNQGGPQISHPTESRDFVIPFQRAYGGMLVQVVLNDHLPARMIVDTGATTVKVNVKLLRKLNQALPANPRKGRAETAAGMVIATEVFIDKIDLGGAVKNQVQASFTDEAHDYPNYDGLLGLSFLSDFKMTIDYDNNVIHLRRR